MKNNDLTDYKLSKISGISYPTIKTYRKSPNLVKLSTKEKIEIFIKNYINNENFNNKNNNNFSSNDTNLNNENLYKNLDTKKTEKAIETCNEIGKLDFEKINKNMEIFIEFMKIIQNLDYENLAKFIENYENFNSENLYKNFNNSEISPNIFNIRYNSKAEVSNKEKNLDIRNIKDSIKSNIKDKDNIESNSNIKNSTCTSTENKEKVENIEQDSKEIKKDIEKVVEKKEVKNCIYNIWNRTKKNGEKSKKVCNHFNCQKNDYFVCLVDLEQSFYMIYEMITGNQYRFTKADLKSKRDIIESELPKKYLKPIVEYMWNNKPTEKNPFGFSNHITFRTILSNLNTFILKAQEILGERDNMIVKEIQCSFGKVIQYRKQYFNRETNKSEDYIMEKCYSDKCKEWVEWEKEDMLETLNKYKSEDKSREYWFKTGENIILYKQGKYNPDKETAADRYVKEVRSKLSKEELKKLEEEAINRLKECALKVG